MTQEELLEKINKIDDWGCATGFDTYWLPKDNEEPFITTLNWYQHTAKESHKKDKAINKLSLDVQVLKQALTRIVELHENVFGYCGTCCWVDKYDKFNSGSYEYRCPTIQAIEKELK